jgi:prohibitin 1
MSRNLLRVILGATVVAGAVGYSGAFVVRPGEAVVLYSSLSGIKPKVFTEGINFRVPFVDDIRLFNVRLQPRTLTTTTGTRDLQMVNIRLRVLYRPEVDFLPQLLGTFAMDYDERVLPSVSNEVLKAVVAEYQAEELIVKRETVSERVFKQMKEKLHREFHIELVDISLVDLQFGKEFMAAVESKQVAQQEAERFKFVVMENEQKKRAAIIRAEGEAESAKLISKALKECGSGLLDLRAIETAKEVAAELAAAPQVNFVPGGMLLNLSGVPSYGHSQGGNAGGVPDYARPRGKQQQQQESH